jgi:hypothetical protein
MPDQGHWGINKPDDWDNKDATQSQNKGNRLHRDQDKTTKDWNAEPNNENWYYNNQNDWDKRNDNDNNNDYNDNQKSDWGHEAKGRARSNRSQGNSNKDHGDRRSRRGSPRHKVNHNSHNDGNHSGSICNNGFVNKVQMHQTSSWVHAQSEPNNPGFHPTSVRSDQCEGRWPNKSPNSGTHHGNKHRDSCNGYHNGPQRQSSRNRLNNTWGNEPSHKQRSQQASGWGQSNQGNDWDKYENQLKHSQAGWDENQQGGMEDWGGGSHHNHNQEWSQDVEKGRTHEPMGW